MSKDALDEAIRELVAHGSSLIMNWGEDTGAWEVAWITGGTRFVAVDARLERALGEVRKRAYEYHGRRER